MLGNTFPINIKISDIENIMPDYYAHSKEGKPPSEWQPLEEHLKNVADLARKFAEVFGAGDWGYLAGLWHDVGREINGFLC